MNPSVLQLLRSRQAPARYCIEPLETRIAPALANPFPLGSVVGTDGFHLSGLGASGFGERPAASAGDVNGDGFEDVIFGATALNAAFVVFGKADGFPADINLTTLNGANGFRIDGTAASFSFGQAVSAAGDLNGDGFADLIVGAFNETIGANNQAGAAYVLFGKASFTATVSIATLNGANGFKLSGVAKNDQAGSDVGAAGDLNGDGYDDVVISALAADPHGSASGSVYVVFGRPSGFAANVLLGGLSGADGFRINGAAANDFLGGSVTSAGDVNGDGFGDLIVGAQGANANGAGSGAAYVIFGRSSFAASLEVSALNGATGFRLRGAAKGDGAGFAVAGGGDVNGDGFADVLVGALSSSANGKYSGAAYVIFGKAAPFTANVALSALTGTDGFRLLGEEANALTGYSVHLADDVNGDGFDDVIVSAPGTAGRASNATTYVVYGQPGFAASIALADLDGTSGVKLLRGQANDSSGSNVSGGDLNGDGLEDIFASDSTGGFVVFGSPAPTVTQVGTKTANTLTGDANADILIAGAAGDMLLGNGGADVLRGGQGDDLFAVSDLNFFRLNGGTGTDTLRLDGAGFALNLTTLSDTKLQGFERIDLTGSGANTLTLSIRDVLNLSPTSNTLSVLGNAGDAVNFGAGWTREVNVTEGPATFEVFTNGAATLRIQQGVAHGLPSGYVLPLFGSELPGLTINGVAAGDQARVVGSAGDVNGDGFDDLFIGARNTAQHGASTGAAYVVFGSAAGFTLPLDLSTLNGTTGFALIGESSGDNAGYSLSSADFNGDGFSDVIVGAFSADGSNPGSGAAYIVFGKASGFAPSLELAALNGTNGFKLRGISTGDDAGLSVHSAGDVNGDGYDDVVIGAPDGAGAGGAVTQAGRAYVVFGRATAPGATFDIAALDGTNGFRIAGTVKAGQLGQSVSGGDVNGDGFSDVIVGSSRGTAPDALVVFGHAGTFVTTVTDSSLNGTNGFQLVGGIGEKVSAAGDVNGDGIGDLIVGAPFAPNPVLTPVGAAYVVFGKVGGTFGKTVDLANLKGGGFRIDGAVSGGYAGMAVSGAGDVNGDGFDDVLVGAAFSNRRGLQSGEAHLIYGAASLPATLSVAALDGTNGFSLFGAFAFARSGQSLSGAGDVNGDGFDDLLVGTYGPGAATATGRSYLIYGFDSGKVTQLGDANANTLTGTAGVDVIVAGRGNDTLLNVGFQDVLRGSQGDDTFSVVNGPLQRLVGGHGFDTLVLYGGLLLDLTARPVYRITGFEQVDLRPGVNYLSLDARAVVNASPDTNTLIVRADPDDVVNIGTGWTATGSEVIDGDTFTILKQGAATLKLSSSFAPIVTLVNATTATYTDVDGDLVTIKTSKGVLGLSDFALRSEGVTGGAQLVAVNFSDDGAEFQNADLSITAQRGALGGDGHVNVGRIEATGVDLGKVTIEGDLGRLNAGDATLTTPGLAALSVGSLGVFGTSTQGAGASLEIIVNGKFGVLTVATDIVDAALGANSFDAVKIGGTLRGNAANTGIFTSGSIGSVSIGQDIRGGAGTFSGVVSASGDIGSVTLGGSLVGGVGTGSGGIFAGGVLGATKIGGDIDGGPIQGKMAIGALTVSGSVLNARILAGYAGYFSPTLPVPAFADATIGAVTVGGDWVASDLVAGVASSDPFFGNGGETLISSGSPAVSGGDPTKIASIKSIAIAGEVLGTAGGVDAFGFVAEEIGSFKVGGTAFSLLKGAGNDTSGLRVGSTLDAKVREVKLLGTFEQPPAVEDPATVPAFNLGSLNGDNGFRFDGLAQGQQVGRTVGSAGDVNGDGFDDLIIGAAGAKVAGQINLGEAYVIFGTDKGLPASIDAKDLNGKNGFRIQAELGNNTSYFAIAVGGAGDVNNDGFDDVIVGGIAIGDLFAGSTEKAFVIFGHAGTFAPIIKGNSLTGNDGFELSHPFAPDPNFTTYNRMSVGGVGDLNQDGFGDVAIGAVNGDFGAQNTGSVYVYFGGATQPASFNLNTLNGTNGFRLDGPSAFANLGYSLSAAGDVNGDGFDDLIAGAQNATVGGVRNGAAYVVYGKSAAFSPTFTTAALNGTNGFRIPGVETNSGTGNTVSGGGDVNGDGFDDIVVGAPYAYDGPTQYPGKSYVIFGKRTSVTGNFPADFNLASLNGTNGFKITGESSYDYAGRAVIAGDINGDGLADIAVGAVGLEAQNEFRGGAYVVFGRTTTTANFQLSLIDGSNGVKLLGIRAGDETGHGISAAGDFNGDGKGDLLIGAYNSVAGSATFVGSAYLVSGASLTSGVKISADQKSATFTDVDGDLVTIKTTAGGFVATDFIFKAAGQAGGIQLQALDLSGSTHAAFAGANLTITAVRGAAGGDGFVNVGALLATGNDLGKVSIDGDLGQLDAGNGDPLKAAVASLTVHSLGQLGLSTQVAAGASLESNIKGKLGAFTVQSDVVGAFVNIDGSANDGDDDSGAITIGGALRGGALANSGSIFAAGDLGAVKIGQGIIGGAGPHSGSLEAGAKIASVTLGNSLLGGAGSVSGSLIAGTSFGAVTINGDATGAKIFARGNLLPASDALALALKSLAITGQVTNTRILAGYGRDGAAANADVQIGAVTVGGDWIASSLVAGVAAGADAKFGTADDASIALSNDLARVSKIASITIKGQALGTVGGTDRFGFVAGQIGAFKVGPTAFPLTPGTDDSTATDPLLLIGATGDLRVHEVTG